MTLIPLTIINILGAILMTSLTGSIMLLLAVPVGILLEKMGFMHIRFELLKGVAFFFLCPVAYIFVKIFEIEVGYGFLFNPTPTISDICTNLLNVWCVGVILCLCHMLMDVYRLYHRYRDAFACEKATQEIFQKKKEQLGVRNRRVNLCQSYHTQVPCVMGLIHTKIILPVEKYTEEELSVILTHELTHYKQKDIWLKQLAFLILVLHFFNPFAWLLFFQVQKQSEYVCDYRSWQQIGDVKRYFEVIMLSAMDYKLFSALSSQLFEKKHELVERVKKMNQISKIKRKPKWAVLAILMTAMLTSNLSVYAATMEGVEQYLEWYEETKVWSDLEPQPIPKCEVVTNYTLDEDVRVVIGEVEQISRSVRNINWEISNNVKMCTGYYDYEEGHVISIALGITPADAYVTVGLELFNGDALIINDCYNQIARTFEIPETGSWRFFILNQSGSTVNVEGSYIY